MQTILLIEDNPADVVLFQEYLHGSETQMYNILNVDSIEKALHLYPILSPDVLVIDLQLPGSGQAETIRLARQYFKDSPMIILTGTDDFVLAQQAFSDGVQDFLVKREITEDLLRRSIQYAIERHRIAKKNEQHTHWLHQHNEQLKWAIRQNL